MENLESRAIERDYLAPKIPLVYNRQPTPSISDPKEDGYDTWDSENSTNYPPKESYKRLSLSKAHKNIMSHEGLVDSIVSEYNDLLIEGLAPKKVLDELQSRYESYGTNTQAIRKVVRDSSRTMSTKKPTDLERLAFSGKIDSIRDSFYQLRDRKYTVSESIDILARANNVKKTAIRGAINRSVSSFSDEEKMHLAKEYFELKDSGTHKHKVGDLARKYNLSSAGVRAVLSSLNNSTIMHNYLPLDRVSFGGDGLKFNYSTRNKFNNPMLYRAQELLSSSNKSQAIEEFMKRYSTDLALAKKYINKANSNIKRQKTLTLDNMFYSNQDIINKELPSASLSSLAIDIAHLDKLPDCGLVLDNLKSFALKSKNKGDSIEKTKQKIHSSFIKPRIGLNQDYSISDADIEYLTAKNQHPIFSNNGPLVNNSHEPYGKTLCPLFAQEEQNSAKEDSIEVSKKTRRKSRSILVPIGKTIDRQLRVIFPMSNKTHTNSLKRYKSLGKRFIASAMLFTSLATGYFISAAPYCSELREDLRGFFQDYMR
jgi:hypothetical protein